MILRTSGPSGILSIRTMSVFKYRKESIWLMEESTVDKITESLLDYRGYELYEDWTGNTIGIDVDVLKETLNRDTKGELVVSPRLIGELLGDNSEVLFIDGLNENVWDEDGEVEELTGVPEQMGWLKSLEKMGPNDFSVVACAKDRDGIAPMLAWFVYRNINDEIIWKKLGVLSNSWSMFEEYGIFSNRESDGDIIYEEAEGKHSDWWEKRAKEYQEAMAEEAGIIAFTVDFKGVTKAQFFKKVFNWKEWPEGLL